MKNKPYFLLIIGFMLFVITIPAYAQTNIKEFQTFSRILSLSRDIPSGSVQLGVVYDPSIPKSKADFNAIKSIIGNGFKGPKHQIIFKAILPTEIIGSDTPVIFITKGLKQDTQIKIAKEARSKKSLTVSTDIQCVKSGNCILGIDVGKRVQVIIKGSTYNDSGLKFNAAFEFMVKEI